MTDYAAILKFAYPRAQWIMRGFEYSGLEWKDSTPKPTQVELDGLWPLVRNRQEWQSVRAQRDRLLSESDWTRMDDAPLTVEQRDTWADYRQALRDVPQEFASPDDVVWPEQPGGF